MSTLIFLPNGGGHLLEGTETSVVIALGSAMKADSLGRMVCIWEGFEGDNYLCGYLKGVNRRLWLRDCYGIESAATENRVQRDNTISMTKHVYRYDDRVRPLSDTPFNRPMKSFLQKSKLGFGVIGSLKGWRKNCGNG